MLRMAIAFALCLSAIVGVPRASATAGEAASADEAKNMSSATAAAADPTRSQKRNSSRRWASSPRSVARSCSTARGTRDAEDLFEQESLRTMRDTSR